MCDNPGVIIMHLFSRLNFHPTNTRHYKISHNIRTLLSSTRMVKHFDRHSHSSVSVSSASLSARPIVKLCCIYQQFPCRVKGHTNKSKFNVLLNDIHFRKTERYPLLILSWNLGFSPAKIDFPTVLRPCLSSV